MFGGRLVSEGAMPIGNLTAFLTTYIAQILISVMMAMMMVILVPRAMASADWVEEVLDAVRSVSDPPRPVTTVGSTGAVEFRTVTFGYPGSEHPVLHALTFTIRPGQACAIIGSTGSGKSTGLNLIPRFFDATAGTVLVNGADVRDQDLEQLWSCIGLVPQRAFLFSGTVASNLRFGRPEATGAELWHALTVAQARDFVASMPGQLDAPIDQGGTNVPGGQRQRQPIARALVKRPGCTCSTTASRRWTPRPTPGCARSCGQIPATRPSSSSPSGSARSCTPTRSSCSTKARSPTSAPTSSC